MFKHKYLKAVLKEPAAEEMKEAEVMWVREMQSKRTNSKERYKRLDPIM